MKVADGFFCSLKHCHFMIGDYARLRDVMGQAYLVSIY